ncbi:hypothetical protein KJB68_08370 [Mammaliicoccus sciuri]|uniref:hypothetical protein n=1 Tax=Mammaliicoccus sciuri TaxID=1296 RepID=UPI001F284425|nr:hypothetical protein [Mammaliicoccus sciuri]MCE5058164.1 hypothetical protein [Mammaliicoccus sciuri]
MVWLLFLNKINGEYVIEQAGSNLVPNKEYDKVLPTTERIARQADKVYFDGEKLQLKEGAALLTVEELDFQEEQLVGVPKYSKSQLYDI